MQKVLNKTKFEQYHWHDSEILVYLNRPEESRDK